MSKQKNKGLDSEPRAADRILNAATILFARAGYEGTSTKSICEAADVNIAAVHYHFGSKEKLFTEIIRRFGGERLEVVRRILIEPQSAADLHARIEMFLTESLNAFIHQPEICRIVQTEMELLNVRSEQVFKETFVKLFDTLVIFLKGAAKRGVIDKAVHPQIAAQFLFNQLRQVTRAEPVNAKHFAMSIRDEKFRELWLKQTVQIFLKGIGLKIATSPKTKS